LFASDDGARSFLEQPALEVAVKALVDKKDSMLSQSISHYKIISQLGAGGMGEVYLAKDTKLDRQVALQYSHSREVEVAVGEVLKASPL
jgi:serine/threonine protein kinase